MEDWRHDAACKPPVQWQMFYQAIWTDEFAHNDRPPAPNLPALQRARSVCRRCPVRRECLLAELAAERGDGVSKRFGLRALMTPHQRDSIEKRGPWPTCPRCFRAADPAQYLDGAWTCCHRTYPVAPLLDVGDSWFARHTSLSLSVVRWVQDNVEVGASMPSPTQLSKDLKARTNDMRRVYQALVEDGTLLDRGDARPRFQRVGRLGASWRPGHLHVSPVM